MILPGAGKVGDHSGLVDNFAVGKVDIPSGAAVVGWRDAKDDRDRTGELPPPVGCVVVDVLEDVLLDVLEEGTEGLLWRVRESPSSPMGSGFMLSS